MRSVVEGVTSSDVAMEENPAYSGFKVTCPDCNLKSALDHAARDKLAS